MQNYTKPDGTMALTAPAETDGTPHVFVANASSDGSATAAKQDTGNTSLASIATSVAAGATAAKQPALGTAAMAASSPVTLATDDTIMSVLKAAQAVKSVYQSTALEASSVVKGSAGTLFAVRGRVDSTLASGTYYVQILNRAALGANGALAGGVLLDVIKVIHASGADDEFDFLVGLGGIAASVGVVVALSTTEFTLTVSSANLSVHGEFT